MSPISLLRFTWLAGLVFTLHLAAAPVAGDFFALGTDTEFADAVAKSDLVTLGRLAAAGENINTAGAYGVTFLAWSLACQRKDSFAFLLEYGANPQPAIQT